MAAIHETESMRILAWNLDQLMRRTPDLDTQNKLAKRSGIGQTTIGRILRKEVAVQIDTLDAIAGAFGLSAWQLLDPSASTGITEEEFYRRMRTLLDAKHPNK